MILEKILKLAEKNSISVSCLEKTLGFGNGTIKKWGESSPSVDKLKKVADYFEILKLAEKNSISVSCLEKTLGFGNGTIKKWGESSPSVDKLKKVADYFDVSIEYFLE